MTSLLYYLLQVIVASGILYGYYHLALRNKKFHRYNRFYLLAATVVSITIPFLNIPVYFTQSETDSSFVLQTLTVISSAGPGDPIVGITKPENNTSWLTWQNLSFVFYILIASLIFIRIIFSLLKIRRIVRNNPAKQLDKIHFINTTEPGTPFSFFRWLFWNKKIELQSEKGEQIFRHELFHIEQKHSWDIMYLELLTVLCWINPFFHLIKKEVKAIHEFLADQFAIKENQHWEYAELLLMQVLNTQQQLVNPFFHNQIKRRIAMITTSNKPSHQYLRKLMVFPVAAVVIGLFAFSYKNKEERNIIESFKSKQIPMDTLSPNKNSFLFYGNVSISTLNGTDKISPAYKINIDGNEIKGITVKKINLEGLDSVRIESGELYINPFDFNNDTTSKPLVVLDGIIQHYFDLNNINPSAIDSVNVLKGPSAIAKYGEQGKKGAIEIITKKNSNKYDLELEYVKENNTIVFSKVEIDPSFPGGEAKWKQYLNVALNKNIPVQSGAPVGTYTAIVRFIVDKEGNLHDIKALTNHGFGMEEEAIRVIAKGPKWIPAVQNGIQVKAYKNQPVTFVVGGNDKTSQINNSFLNEVVVVAYLEGKGRYPKDSKAPSFVGGEKEWRAYLERNVSAMVAVDNGALVGTYTTVTQFLVNADGTTSEFKSLTNHGYGMEEEALRVIQSAKQWDPAVVNGKKVNSYKKQPVTFQILTDGSDEPILTKTNADQLSSIYPNPSNNFVVIPFNSQLAEKGEIRITDINGNSKMTIPASFAKGVNNLSVNVASLAKGIYVVNVVDAGKKIVRTYKMLKQ